MAKIYIDTKKVRPCVTRLGDLAQALKQSAQETDSIRSGLRYKIAGRAEIEAQLRAVSEQILREETSMRSMRDTLEQIAGWYERTENANLGRITPDGADENGGGSSETVTLPDWLRHLRERYGPSISSLIPLSAPVVSLLNFLLADTQVSGEQGFWRADSDVKRGGGAEWEYEREEIKDWKHGSQFYYDPQSGKVTYVDSKDADAMNEFKEHNKADDFGIPVDLKLFGIGSEASVSVYGGEGKVSNRYGGAEGSYDLGKAEANASFYAGLGGVGAEMGASVTAFTAEGKAYLGDEDTQAYVKGKVTAGKAEAKMGAQAGLYDKDGNFKPSVYAGVSAEAIAGEVSGSVGAKVLGTDVALEGSLNYGVGVHADVGMHDGKISVDVGATLGVGASVKLEIDVSGTLDAIHDKAGEVWSEVTNLFGW